MFDTMTMTKAVGALCGALLIFLMGNWAGDALYGFYGHDEAHEQSYVIDTGESDAPAETVVEVAFADVYTVATADAGERLWRQCSACHALEPGKNGTGPSLHGIVDRAKGASDGYAYSSVLAGMGGEWTPEKLSNFIANPREYAPGTKMGYAGMKDIADRANLIAYLATFN